MRFLLSTLSLSYVRRHTGKTFLTLLGVVVGVATFGAIKGAQASLEKGIRGTVDRIAGKAELQLTAEGGVPEEVQERLREHPAVRAQSPVIEQVVVPERGELGSLLVLGVDLLGDREMRDYSFEGEDADLDDPLLFLAQPDSVAVARPLAARANLSVGDGLVLKLPSGPKRVTVRGLLTPKGFAEAFGGNLLVMDVYAAQDLFGRGRRFDRLELRLPEGTTVADARTALEAALGPGLAVETPERRGEQMEKLIRNFTAQFHVTSGFALGIGTFLIFNAFAVAVNRRRRDVGTLRALGATPGQVQALFLLEAAAIGLAGGVLGVLLGAALAQSALTVMQQGAEGIYGIPDASRARLTGEMAVRGVLLGVAASLVGALAPARAASRIPATEAFAKGTFQVRTADERPSRLLLGVALLLLGVAAGIRPPVGGDALAVLVLLLGAGATILLAGPASRRLLALGARPVARLFPASGPLAADSLLSNPRRTSGTVTAMTLSLTLVVGLGGYVRGLKGTLSRWMNDVLTSDLYVRASASFARPDYRFDPAVREEIRSIPGVRSVESYRTSRLPYRGDRVLLASIEVAQMLDRVRYDFLEGSEEAARREVAGGGACLVSDNFQRKFGIGAGGVVELAGAGAIVRLPVAAVVRDYSSDRGTILVDRKTFLAHWKDDRVDTFDVNLHPGADPGAVRDAIRARLAGRMPALVSTRREFVADVTVAIDAFFAMLQVAVVLALLVGLLGTATSLLISVAERTREIGILKALGAVGAQVRRSVVLEALAVASVSFVLSIPLGTLLALFVEKTIADVYSGWVLPHEAPWGLLAQLVVALPAVAFVAAWVPARQAARLPVPEAITYE